MLGGIYLFCSNCGQKIDDSSNFCPYCGTSFKKVQPQQTVRQQQPQYVSMQKPIKKKSGVKKAVTITVLVVVLACLTGLGVFIASSLGSPNLKGHFKQGNIIVENTAAIDNLGGTVSLPDTSTLAGSSVVIPSATVSSSVNVSIGTVTGTYTDAPQSISKTAFYLDLGGYKNITQPIEITFKYANDAAGAEKIPVGIYIDENGNLNPVITKCINKTAGTFTILTYHASTYTFYVLEDMSTYKDSADTGYRPSADGFSEKNDGSSVFSGGECYGMSSFSKWYYLNKKSFLNGGLFNKYKSPQMGVSPTGDIIVPQDVIATKAFQYTTRESSILWDTERRFSSYVNVDNLGTVTYQTDNSVAVRCIMDSLYFWQQPCEVGIYGSAGHSVLAYRYTKDADYIYIYIYDPNFPGEDDQYIRYEIATGLISTPAYQAGFLDSRLTTTGYGTFTCVSEYEKIYNEAKNNFAGDIADIEITSPTNGVTVADGTCFITGTLDTLQQKGEQIGDMVEIVSQKGLVYRAYLSKYSTDPSTFSVEVPLTNGENKFLINIIYYDENGNERLLSHDLYGWFIINSTVAGNVINVTLTWDSQPDVDLYVTDPTGSTSYFRNFTTSDGGTLDIDDTSSYGPEHWTLTSDNTIRWGQPYYVKLHYYSGQGPTRYTVTVTVNGGTQNEITKTYTGTISTSNGYNADPGSSGSDWVDICTITPSNG